MSQPRINVDEFRVGVYQGYDTRFATEADDELTKVGPGTPCGEYLRRFWHPVALSSELSELPRAIRILGEELVYFGLNRVELGWCTNAVRIDVLHSNSVPAM